MESIKNKRIFLLFFTFLFLHSVAIYAETTHKRLFYRTFVNREMHKWGEIIHSVETNIPPKTIEQKLELLNYYYGYVGYLMNKKKYETAEISIEKGEDLIDNVIKLSPHNSTALSYKGAFMGFKMGLNKVKAVYFAPKCMIEINKAYKADHENTQIIINKANLLFYSPTALGGDKDEALNLYHKALVLMEKNKETEQNWNYLNLLTTIAIGFDKTGKFHESKKMYERILKFEPDYKWVRDDLYPNLLKRM
ncbi:MAG: hypothetical protein WCK78_05245 [Paludibacter sp.]